MSGHELSLAERIESAKSLGASVVVGHVPINPAFVDALANDLLRAPIEEIVAVRAQLAHLVAESTEPEIVPAGPRDEAFENMCDEEGG